MAMSLYGTDARPSFKSTVRSRLISTRIERAAHFLEGHAHNALCDSCIAAGVGFFSVTDASYAANALKRRIGKFTRHRGTCTRCDKQRFVTSAL